MTSCDCKSLTKQNRLNQVEGIRSLLFYAYVSKSPMLCPAASLPLLNRDRCIRQKPDSANTTLVHRVEQSHYAQAVSWFSSPSFPSILSQGTTDCLTRSRNSYA